MYYSNFSGTSNKNMPYFRLKPQQTSLNNFTKPQFIPNDSSNTVPTLKHKFTKNEKLLMINNQITFNDIDPLGVLKSEKLTMKELISKYMSLRKLYHQDKGGNAQQFILVNNAVKKNGFLQQGFNSDKQFDQLKNNYNSQMKTKKK